MRDAPGTAAQCCISCCAVQLRSLRAVVFQGPVLFARRLGPRRSFAGRRVSGGVPFIPRSCSAIERCVLLVYFDVVSSPTYLKLLAARLRFNLHVLRAVCCLLVCGTLLHSPLLEVVFVLARAHSALLSARTLC